MGHNIPNARISETNSEILSVSGTSDATVFEDQVYTLDGSSDCLLITFEDGSAQGDSDVGKHVRAHRLSGVCANGNVKVLSAGGTDATAGPTALVETCSSWIPGQTPFVAAVPLQWTSRTLVLVAHAPWKRSQRDPRNPLCAPTVACATTRPEHASALKVS